MAEIKRKGDRNVPFRYYWFMRDELLKTILSELAPSVRPLSGLQKRPARVKNPAFQNFSDGYTAKNTCVPNFKFLALLEVG
ncbi:hypothetical protein J6590_079198 [Homalodisca vitripennis]|nr:hypothetical protein J6590_079198 [Homalodisca vitripennis]